MECDSSGTGVDTGTGTGSLVVSVDWIGRRKPGASLAQDGGEGFEFVLMGPDGGLDKAGISQIRAHTTRELHKTRRQTGQVCYLLLVAS